MKTPNYDLELITPTQVNKDIIFNESQLKLDIFTNLAIINFVEILPREAVLGEKYILSTKDEKNNYVAYCTNLSKGWQLLKPQPGMINFVLKAQSFFIFQNDSWQKIELGGNVVQAQQNASSAPMVTTALQDNLVKDGEHFTGIDSNFTLPQNCDYQYLYLNNNCKIDISQVQTRSFTLIIKQNYAQLFNIEWSGNILWKDKSPVQITQVKNSIDVIKFHRLIETKHFIAEVIGQNYQF
jgi:hypothetical protein